MIRGYLVVFSLIYNLFFSVPVQAQDRVVERISSYFADLTRAKKSLLDDSKVDAAYRGKPLEADLRDYAIAHFSSSDAEDLAIVWRRANMPGSLFVSMVPTGNKRELTLLELKGVEDGRIIASDDGILHLKTKGNNGGIRDAYIALDYLGGGNYTVRELDIVQAQNPRYRPFFRDVTLGIPVAQTQKEIQDGQSEACSSFFWELTRGDPFKAGNDFVSDLMTLWEIDTEQAGHEKLFGERWNAEYRWIGCRTIGIRDLAVLLNFPALRIGLESNGYNATRDLENSVYALGSKEGEWYYHIDVNLPLLVDGKLMTEKDMWMQLRASGGSSVNKRRIRRHLRLLEVGGGRTFTLDEL